MNEVTAPEWLKPPPALSTARPSDPASGSASSGNSGNSSAEDDSVGGGAAGDDEASSALLPAKGGEDDSGGESDEDGEGLWCGLGELFPDGTWRGRFAFEMSLAKGALWDLVAWHTVAVAALAYAAAYLALIGLGPTLGPVVGPWLVKAGLLRPGEGGAAWPGAVHRTSHTIEGLPRHSLDIDAFVNKVCKRGLQDERGRSARAAREQT